MGYVQIKFFHTENIASLLLSKSTVARTFTRIVEPLDAKDRTQSRSGGASLLVAQGMITFAPECCCGFPTSIAET